MKFNREHWITFLLYLLGFVMLFPTLWGSLGGFDPSCNGMLCGTEALGQWYDRIETELLLPTLGAIFPMTFANYRISKNGMDNGLLNSASFIAVMLAASDMSVSHYAEQLEAPLAILGFTTLGFNGFLVAATYLNRKIPR